MPYGKRWSWDEADIRKYVDELKGVTIPVDIHIEGRQKVLALDQMNRLLRKARRIAVGDCECRAKVKGCDAPLDVCLYLDDAAEEQVARGMGEMIDLKTALDTLRRSHEAGLVHVAYTESAGKDPCYICSCCACCCHSFTAMQRFGFSDAIVSSDKVAVQNEQLCDDCGLCVDRCHFKARTMKNGKLAYREDMCFGCGLCMSVCEDEAISLHDRHGH